MTDLRDQLATVPLTDRRGTGHTLYRLRREAGYSLAGLANRLHISRSGVHRREAIGYLPSSALIEHLDALGYDLIAVRRPTDRRTT